MSHKDEPTSSTPSPNDTLPAPAPPEPAAASEPQQQAAWIPQQSRLVVKVQGGTTSWNYDQEQARKVADAEARRKQLDADKHLASIPIEQGGGKMFTHHFANPLTTPKVLLRYVNAKKESIMEMLCELVVDDNTGDAVIQFVCPKCVMRGIHPGEAQCTVRDAHRKWHLDTRGAGEIRKAPDVDMAGRHILTPYLYAGEIMDTDVLGCSNFNCGARYKIHKNMLYDFVPGGRR